MVDAREQPRPQILGAVGGGEVERHRVVALAQEALGGHVHARPDEHLLLDQVLPLDAVGGVAVVDELAVEAGAVVEPHPEAPVQGHATEREPPDPGVDVGVHPPQREVEERRLLVDRRGGSPELLLEHHRGRRHERHVRLGLGAPVHAVEPAELELQPDRVRQQEARREPQAVLAVHREPLVRRVLAVEGQGVERAAPGPVEPLELDVGGVGGRQGGEGEQEQGGSGSRPA